MRGLFCPTCRARNNEEYRAVLKKRQRKLSLYLLAGIATEGICLFLHFCTPLTMSEYHLGFLLGLGGGLMLGGVMGIWRIRRRLASEEKLKEFRLRETDERELEVDSLALRATAKILLFVMYLLLLVSGIFDLEWLFRCCWGLIAIFLVSYFLCRKYYRTKI